MVSSLNTMRPMYRNYNTDCLSGSERHSVDLLDSALDYCRDTMVSAPHI